MRVGWLPNLFGRTREKSYAEIQGDGRYNCEVVGESHYQEDLNAIAGGKTVDGHELACTALLQPEPHNAHDRNAIAVVIDGHKVGHLTRHHARQMSAVFRRNRLDGAYAKAMIVGGWMRDGKRNREGHYGVRLDIPVND